MQDFINFFGHGFCHQIAERSFAAGGLVFSACARDSGIYLGFMFALIAAFIVYAVTKQKPAELPPWPFIVLLVLLVLPMALDGVTSYLGLRETTNTVRYVTGALTGCAAGSIVAPLLFSLTKNANAQQKIFAKPLQTAAHLIIALALAAAFLFLYPYLGVVSPLLAIAAFLLIIGSVNLILITLSKRLFPKHTLAHWAFLLFLVLAMTIVEIAALGALREAAEHFLLGGHDISEFYR